MLLCHGGWRFCTPSGDRPLPVTRPAKPISRVDSRGAARRESPQHNVVYFRSRDEYNGALGAMQPKIEISIGIYFPAVRTAYFFADEQQQPDTLYHEATHQLFQETRPAVVEPGRANNFWVVEGIACYMESLDESQPGVVTLGGANASRMASRAQRSSRKDRSLPLAELVQMGAEAVQRDPRIKDAVRPGDRAWPTFFMHDDAGPISRAAGATTSRPIYAGTRRPPGTGRGDRRRRRNARPPVSRFHDRRSCRRAMLRPPPSA